MIHTNVPRNCTVFLLPRRLTRSAIYGSQIFDSHKWPTFLVHTVKGEPRNFKVNLCGSLYSTFKTSSQPYAFYKNGYKRFLWTNSTDPRQCVPLSTLCSADFQGLFEKNPQPNHSGRIRRHNVCEKVIVDIVSNSVVVYFRHAGVLYTFRMYT